MGELEALWERHREHFSQDDARAWCSACPQRWPCDTAVALAEVERLRERVAELQKVGRNMHQAFYFKTNPGEPCRQSGHIPVALLDAWLAALEGKE